MEISLGQPVVSTDGDQIGKVDALALDADTQEVRQIIIRQGMFLSTNRIIDHSMVERVGDDGTVYLNISSAQSEEMPPFVEEQFVVAREEDLRHMPHAWAGWDPLAAVWSDAVPASGPVARQTPTPEDNASFFDVPSTSPGPLENVSNLSEDMVLISTGTDVVGSDGEKIGSVDEVLYDEEGRVAGFVVKAGFLFHHDVRVPADWIDTVGGETVQLNVTAEQAENGNA